MNLAEHGAVGDRLIARGLPEPFGKTPDRLCGKEDADSTPFVWHERTSA